MKILIGQISSNKAIAVAGFIKAHYSNIEIYTYDIHKFTEIIRTKYSDKHFVIKNSLSQIANLIKEEQIDYFFPVINNDIKQIFKEKDVFGSSLNYLGDEKTFVLLNDKQRLMQIAKRIGIKIPTTRTIDSLEIQYPCVIKPISGSSSKGVVYIHSKGEFSKIRKTIVNKDNFIVQDFISGAGVGYSVYAIKGKIVTGYGHRRLAEYPISGGSSVYRESYLNKDMEIIAKKILEYTQWTGFVMFEFKLTRNNEVYLIEANPRIWGSINQGLQNGVNYFEGILGKSNTSLKNEVKTYFSPYVFITFILYLFKLNFKPLITFIKNIKRNKADVSIIQDPFGYISILLRKLL